MKSQVDGAVFENLVEVSEVIAYQENDIVFFLDTIPAAFLVGSFRFHVEMISVGIRKIEVLEIFHYGQDFRVGPVRKVDKLHIVPGQEPAEIDRTGKCPGRSPIGPGFPAV